MIDAVLPPTFRHSNCENLVRLGSTNDGGYLVAEQDVRRADVLVALGIGDNWEFERHFSKLNGVSIIAYDASVGSGEFRNQAIRTLLRARKLRASIRLFRKYLDFRRFFKKGPRHRHIAKFVGAGYLDVPMRTVLTGANARNAFVKMDIEGSEYRCLDALIEFQDTISGAVIEFHDVDLHLDRIQDFVSRFKLNLVHIHANNFAPVTDCGLPQVLELTFSKSCEPNGVMSVYPNRLDQPNNPNRPEIRILFAAEEQPRP